MNSWHEHFQVKMYGERGSLHDSHCSFHDEFSLFFLFSHKFYFSLGEGWGAHRSDARGQKTGGIRKHDVKSKKNQGKYINK